MTLERRYRTESGQHCIDIRLKMSHQLFDRRDPAPLRERDIDDEAVEYILGATEEIHHDAALKIVLQITDEPEPRAIHDALVDERKRIERLLAADIEVRYDGGDVVNHPVRDTGWREGRGG